MKPSQILEEHRQEVRDLVAAHGFENVRVFGSVARGDDDDLSDIDFIVDAASPDIGFAFGDLFADLSGLLGVKINLLTERSLPLRFRDRALSEAIPV